MNKTVFRPLLSDRIYMLIWIGVACLLMITAFHVSWVLDYSGKSISDYVLEEKFDPSAMDLGIFLSGLILLILAIEIMGRSVEIDAVSLRSFSPLRLYRQSLPTASVEAAKLTPLLVWGRVLELQVDGKWIVFIGNGRFKNRVHSYLPSSNVSVPTNWPV